METSTICTVCRNGFAEWFCCCVFPVVAVCTHCQASHSGKSVSAVHSFFPYRYQGFVNSATAAANIRQKLFLISEAEAQLRTSIDLFEACEREIERASRSVKSAVDQMAETAGEVLKKMRGEMELAVENALEEVKSHFVDAGYRMSSELATRICSFTLQEKELQAFQYSVRTIDVKETLSQCIQISFQTDYPLHRWNSSIPTKAAAISDSESLTQLPVLPIEVNPAIISLSAEIQQLREQLAEARPNVFKIPYLTPSSVHFFDCLHEHWETELPLSQKLALDDLSSSVVLKNGDLICFGGLFPVTPAKVYRVQSNTGSVTTLDSLITPRIDHGTVAVGDTLYAFGGYNEATLGIASAEKLTSSEKWVSLGNMLSPRCKFTPCAHKSLIYCCGGADTEVSEMFNLKEETFATLPFSLPMLPHRSFSFIEGSDLLVIQGKHISRWKLGSDASVQGADLTTSEQPELGNTPPVLIGSQVFFLARAQKNALQMSLVSDSLTWKTNR